MEKRIERENQKEQGFFDGRFAPKIVPNRKAKENKNICRKKIRF